MTSADFRTVLGLLALTAFATPVLAQTTTKPDTAMPMAMMSKGLLLPNLDPVAGRALFAAKGCVVCHSVNGVGGQDAPALDAALMDNPMNPFDFAASMWRGSEAMVALQRDELGGQIELTGQELADITAFVHDAGEQAKFSMADIPAKISALMMKMNGGN